MDTNESPLASSSWGCADDVFDRLQGRWQLRREITGGIRMQGEAVFLSAPDGMLAYHEQGRVQLPDGKAFDGSRDYRFERTEGGFLVHFAEIPLRLFHRIVIQMQDGSGTGSASHLCAADTYRSRYAFHCDGSFTIEHVVAGPRKDYASTTVFTRLA